MDGFGMLRWINRNGIHTYTQLTHTHSIWSVANCAWYGRGWRSYRACRIILWTTHVVLDVVQYWLRLQCIVRLLLVLLLGEKMLAARIESVSLLSLALAAAWNHLCKGKRRPYANYIHLMPFFHIFFCLYRSLNKMLIPTKAYYVFECLRVYMWVNATWSIVDMMHADVSWPYPFRLNISPECHFIYGTRFTFGSCSSKHTHTHHIQILPLAHFHSETSF